MTKRQLRLPEAVPAPADYEPADVAALQALLAGNANQVQQERALDWIITHACRTYDQPYRSERPHDTAFEAGRMFAGQQIVKMLKLKLSKIEGIADGRNDQR